MDIIKTYNTPDQFTHLTVNMSSMIFRVVIMLSLVVAIGISTILSHAV